LADVLIWTTGGFEWESSGCEAGVASSGAHAEVDGAVDRNAFDVFDRFFAVTSEARRTPLAPALPITWQLFHRELMLSQSIEALRHANG
jgi:hypothetical protein